MKFTNGFWLDRKGWTIERAKQIRQVAPISIDDRPVLEVLAPIKNITSRGDTLNTGLFDMAFEPIAPGVIRVRQHRWRKNTIPPIQPELSFDPTYQGSIDENSEDYRVTADNLSVTVPREGTWDGIRVSLNGENITEMTTRSVGLAISPDQERYSFAQFVLQPGERVYGLGERFGHFVKNGQSVDIWNEDGGTSSEQAYKNVPFYISTAGYGILVLNTGDLSFEIGSEAVSRIQFSVSGDELEYLIIAGPSPKEILERYTALTGRPPKVPAWSYGLWLTTSFTTSYDEETVMSFIDGMAERDIPLSVFHFDTFWMREFHWCDFVWDPVTFPDPRGLIQRIKDKGLKVCVWINPYIAQRSRLWEEGAENGYLVKRSDGSIWHTDLWQAGLSLVDFTNPKAAQWYRGELKKLLDMGVDCFKTDFGERIPVSGIAWHNGADPVSMHNYYAHLYNRTVFDLLTEERGEGEAVLFARSATVGGQAMPVHWGGDCDSTYASMGETLRGGLSIAMSGFSFWSHDIGGFEGMPDAGLFKRWLAFGLLSSHSRLHGSGTVRVPWVFDEEAVEVTRRFVDLKLRLMPYIGQAAREAHKTGTPVLRPMVLEFPEDPATREIDTQFMLGSDILVAPVFRPDGKVTYYLPAGKWRSLFSGDVLTGSRWVTETHGYSTLPVMIREGAVIPFGKKTDTPVYNWADGVTLDATSLFEGQTYTVTIPASDAGTGAPDVTFTVAHVAGACEVTTTTQAAWNLKYRGQEFSYEAGTSTATIRLSEGS
ncbi:alpha-xylosidase [Actinotignum sp. GS-2025b]|uniref:alpha-xylosidase n=1 Tax=Actinotignum sp. GS-2025b TaxID=3427275 RepID=UPI003F47E75D